jgi:hypothetical protein
LEYRYQFIQIGAINLFPLATEQQQAIFCYQIIGLPLSVVSSRRPIEMDKPHILAEATETGFFAS